MARQDDKLVESSQGIQLDCHATPEIAGMVEDLLQFRYGWVLDYGRGHLFYMHKLAE